MRSKLQFALAATALITLQHPVWAHEAPTPRGEPDESAAMAANRGFNMGLTPTLLLPMRRGGPFGGGLGIDARYGIKAGALVLAPGGLLAGYNISRRFIGVPMGTFRITAPIGPFAPYALGGVGYGWISNPSEAGLAYLVGGGMMLHFGRWFAIGLQATYQAITTTDFRGLALGPLFSIGL